MLFNVVISDKAILKLLDQYPVLKITQKFKDRDYALEVPDPIIDEVTEFVQTAGFTITPITKARD